MGLSTLCKYHLRKKTAYPVKSISLTSGTAADHGFCSFPAAIIVFFLVFLAAGLLSSGTGQDTVPLPNHSAVQDEKNITFSDFPVVTQTPFLNISDEPGYPVVPPVDTVSRVNISPSSGDFVPSDTGAPLVPPADYDASFNTSGYLLKINNSATYEMSGEILALNSTTAPLVIAYRVDPLNITDVKWFSPRDAQKKIDTAVVKRPYEYAWFRVTLVNADTNATEFQQGWARPYATPPGYQEFTLYKPGNYRIELSGCYVTVRFLAFVKKPGS